MRLIKLAFVGSLLVAMLALMSGVLQVFVEQQDGGVKFAPHVSRPVLRWYVGKASAAVGTEPVLSGRPR